MPRPKKQVSDEFEVDLSPATPETTQGQIVVKGTDDGKRRCFQTNPATKEWLTKAEAEDKGFYWAD